MKVQCLVDNSVRPSSAFWGEHGLAFLIDADDGRRLLFDTGASGAVLLHNLESAGVDIGTIDAVVLSHSHPDHTGGLPSSSGNANGPSRSTLIPSSSVPATPRRAV